jgi:hypothetical protein
MSDRSRRKLSLPPRAYVFVGMGMTSQQVVSADYIGVVYRGHSITEKLC